MNNKGKPISLIVSDEANILALVNAHIETNVEQTSWMRLSLPTLNPVMKNHEETGRSFVHCRPFSKQWKSLKCSPLEELESTLAACFEQTCERNASMNGTQLKEKCLHIPASLEVANVLASNGWIGRFKGRNNISCTTVSVRRKVSIQKL